MTGYELASMMGSIAVELEIRMGTHNHRIRGTWVGQRENEYLIIDIPRKYNWIEVREWFYNCTSVVLRGVGADGQVFAAATRFIGLNAKPFRQLYLSPPERLELRSLRKVPRLAVDIDALLCFTKEVPQPSGVPEGFKGLPGRVTDISRTGIAFETEQDLPFSYELFTNQLVDLKMYSGKTQLAEIIGEARGARLVGKSLLQFGIAVDARNRDYHQAMGQLILSSRHIEAVLKGE